MRVEGEDARRYSAVRTDSFAPVEEATLAVQRYRRRAREFRL